MTITVFSPTTGRVGAGTNIVAQWDFIGPHVPGTTMEVALEDPSSGSKFQIATFPFMTNDLLVAFFDLTHPQSVAFQEGRADGFACRMRLSVNVPGSGIVDDVVQTGLVFDAVSGLGFVLFKMGLYVVANAASGVSQLIEDIHGAVIGTYSSS